MVIDGGAPTTVSYISNALPIPADKNEIALCTAMAGEMLGMKMIYMDAGSGARRPITTEMIERVSENIEIPLLIGGGIQSPEKVYHNARAGADIIVVGNAIEKDASLLAEMASALHSVSLEAQGLKLIVIFNSIPHFIPHTHIHTIPYFHIVKVQLFPLKIYP